MEIATLENCTIADIADVLNASFSDYIVPLNLNIEQLEYKIVTENIHLDLSVGVFSSGQLVGFMLHALQIVDGKLSAYNAATGIIPAYRGRGLVGKMYQYLLPKLKTRAVVQMRLEVIIGNNAAIRAYEKMGYQVNRTLDCFKGSVQTVKKSCASTIRELQDFQWDQFVCFWTIKPSWQNAIPTLEKAGPHLTILGAFIDEKLIGYLIYNANSKKIQQIAISPAHRRKGIATQLVMTMTQQINSKEIYVLNVDHISLEAISFFKQLGLVDYLAQFEMKKIL